MYSADLWLHTRTAVESGEPVVTVWFAGQSHTVPRTEAEDLLELIEASFISQQEAALVR